MRRSLVDSLRCRFVDHIRGFFLPDTVALICRPISISTSPKYPSLAVGDLNDDTGLRHQVHDVGPSAVGSHDPIEDAGAGFILRLGHFVDDRSSIDRCWWWKGCGKVQKGSGFGALKGHDEKLCCDGRKESWRAEDRQ